MFLPPVPLNSPHTAAREFPTLDAHHRGVTLMSILLILNALIVCGLVYISGVVAIDAFTKRRTVAEAELHQSQMPPWARKTA